MSSEPDIQKPWKIPLVFLLTAKNWGPSSRFTNEDSSRTGTLGIGQGLRGALSLDESQSTPP